MKRADVTATECECEKTAAVATVTLENAITLFTKQNCPNCKVAKSMLERAGIEFAALDANENAELSKALELKAAPTLVVFDGTDPKKYSGVPAIKEYLATL